MKGLCDLYIYDKDGVLVGTVGWFYYSRHTLKELCDMYGKNGYVLRF